MLRIPQNHATDARTRNFWVRFSVRSGDARLPSQWRRPPIVGRDINRFYETKDRFAQPLICRIFFRSPVPDRRAGNFRHDEGQLEFRKSLDVEALVDQGRQTRGCRENEVGVLQGFEVCDEIRARHCDAASMPHLLQRDVDGIDMRIVEGRHYCG